MSKNILAFAAAAIFTLSLVSFAFCEDLTITTYYPSPNGSYRDLQITNHLEASGTPTSGNSVIHVVNNATTPNTSAIQGSVGGVSGALGRVDASGEQYGVYGQDDGGAGHFAGYFSGNVAVTGMLYVMRGPGMTRGCITMSYGSNSMFTQCPTGFTYNAALSPAWTDHGGIFYCCG